MLLREQIMQELQDRMWDVPNVTFVARNPNVPLKPEQLPAIQFFEMIDPTEGRVEFDRGYPIYKRSLTVIIESFIKGSTEAASSKELSNFIRELKKKLYAGGPTLGDLCMIAEVEAGRVLRPPPGDNMTGIGFVLAISYREHVQDLFTTTTTTTTSTTTTTA